MEALETTKYNLKAQSIIESAVFNFNRNGFTVPLRAHHQKLKYD